MLPPRPGQYSFGTREILTTDDCARSKYIQKIGNLQSGGANTPRPGKSQLVRERRD